MNSRLIILAMLVVGILFSTAGVGLALETGGDAAVAQYGPELVPTVGPSQPVARPTPPSLGPTPTPSSTTTSGGVQVIERRTPATLVVLGTLEERQHGALAESSKLPVTGLAAIPVLLGGVALLAGGLVVRRRTRAD